MAGFIAAPDQSVLAREGVFAGACTPNDAVADLSSIPTAVIRDVGGPSPSPPISWQCSFAWRTGSPRTSQPRHSRTCCNTSNRQRTRCREAGLELAGQVCDLV
jgi:hypothetical protein